MGSKIFISYKYADTSVCQYSNLGKIINGMATPRSYVNHLDPIIKKLGHVAKWEDNNEDLSHLSASTIASKLNDRMYDSSVTIILISPQMKEIYKLEEEQWIPREISYSLKGITRRDRTSHPNAILCVVLPDSSGNYGYFMTITNNIVNFNHSSTFRIIKNNMQKNCYYDSQHQNYFVVAKVDDFINNTDKYINLALINKNNFEIYNVSTGI